MTGRDYIAALNDAEIIQLIAEWEQLEQNRSMPDDSMLRRHVERFMDLSGGGRSMVPVVAMTLGMEAYRLLAHRYLAQREGGAGNGER